MAVMTIVVLARHGETIWHAENRYAGSTDVALTDLGRRQAEDLGAWATFNGISAVYASDLSRAVLTAAPAAAALGMVTNVDPRLREVDFGAGEGMTATEMAKAFPEKLARFRSQPATCPLPGGESGTAAADRAWQALDDIRKSETDTVLVVMHSTLMRLVLCRALGIPLDNYRKVFPAALNVAATTVDLTPGRAPALLNYNVPVAAPQRTPRRR
jgi:broad specificity phosphatase PhoE